MPKLLLAFSLCLLGASCAHSGASTASTGGTGAGASGGFNIDHLDGDWVGTMYPNSGVLDPFNFYFSAENGGLVSEAADSQGSEWLAIDSDFVTNMLSSGRFMLRCDSMISVNRLLLDGDMDDTMNQLTGEYEYVNNYGIPIRGNFILERSTGPDYFAEVDYSGVWEGGFGVGRNENKRQLDFVIDSDGTVISGTMTNIVTGYQLHHYSAGSGTFQVTNQAVGRIDNMTLVADDGSIAVFDYLLINRDLTLIGGQGVDQLVGSGMVEIRR
ncbi:MAG: hypothetical protein QGF46_03195 [Planctomycetota bacterium]|nr:hypothetical protein [Planctomycetota bacterium]